MASSLRRCACRALLHSSLIRCSPSLVICCAGRRFDAATAKLQADAQVRGAENAAQSEREAAADETESAARDRRVEELTQRIAELEGRNAVCGTLSRDAVRALNTAR